MPILITFRVDAVSHLRYSLSIRLSPSDQDDISQTLSEKMAIKSPSTLILRRFCGEESFKIIDATMMVWHNDDGGIDINFEIETDPEPIQTLEDTRELQAKPGAEITLTIPSFDPDALAGRSFQIPKAHTDDEEDFTGRFYYCEHEGVSSNHVEILKQEGNQFHVRWTGETCDVNFYDGSKPPTKIEIDAVFTFSEYLKWKSA